MPDTFSSAFDRLRGGRRVAAVLVGVGALAAMWGFGRWATQPAWVPLFRELPLESVAGVTARLDEGDIDYRLERAGTALSVREQDLARARVALAAEGFPAAGRPGFELFDQPSWGMTDFTQRVNYRRALEGELERTIGRMRDVEAAQVHLALQESSFLRASERPAEASVVLTLRSGARAGEGMVEGIQFLVAGSVEGMSTERVTVLDDGGRVLSSTSDPASAEGLSSMQLTLRREVEGYLELKAQDLLAAIVGAGNASVRVAADLNFDRVDRTTQAVDPESQITLSEDRSEIVPGTEEQGAGSVTSNQTFETSRTVETFSRGGAQIDRLTVAVLVNQRRGADGEAAPIGDGELARIEALVRNAVGVNEARGDLITVAAVPFDVLATPAGPLVAPPAGMGPVDWIQMLQRPVLGLVGLVLAFLVALKLLANLRGPSGPRRADALPPGATAARGAVGAGGGDDEDERAPTHRPRMELPEPRRVEVQRPDMTARVIKAWLKEA